MNTNNSREQTKPKIDRKSIIHVTALSLINLIIHSMTISIVRKSWTDGGFIYLSIIFLTDHKTCVITISDLNNCGFIVNPPNGFVMINILELHLVVFRRDSFYQGDRTMKKKKGGEWYRQ